MERISEYRMVSEISLIWEISHYGVSVEARTNSGSKILTSEELLRRAVNMVPTLKSRAAHTEELRRIPEETVQEFLSASLNRIEVPKRFGGLEVDYDLVF